MASTTPFLDKISMIKDEMAVFPTPPLPAVVMVFGISASLQRSILLRLFLSCCNFCHRNADCRCHLDYGAIFPGADQNAVAALGALLLIDYLDAFFICRDGLDGTGENAVLTSTFAFVRQDIVCNEVLADQRRASFLHDMRHVFITEIA